MAGTHTRESIAALVLQAAAACAKNEIEVTAEATFDDLGLDSLDAVVLSMILEEDIDHDIDPDMWHAASTIRQIIDDVARQVGVSE